VVEISQLEAFGDRAAQSHRQPTVGGAPSPDLLDSKKRSQDQQYRSRPHPTSTTENRWDEARGCPGSAVPCPRRRLPPPNSFVKIRGNAGSAS
jgi:hypothetical protein